MCSGGGRGAHRTENQDLQGERVIENLQGRRGVGKAIHLQLSFENDLPFGNGERFQDQREIAV